MIFRGAAIVLVLAACSSGSSRHEGGGADVPAAGGASQVASAATDLAGPTPQAIAKTNAVAGSTRTGKPAAPAARPAEDAAPVDLVTIHVLVEPPQRGHVIWGAKDFGLGPVDIRRPRGSGPLDLLVRAPGYLTLHTRAFTDRDNTLSVRLVPEDEAARFPGYQAPAATVTGRAKTAAPSARTTARAMRSGKPSDGAGAP